MLNIKQNRVYVSNKSQPTSVVLCLGLMASAGLGFISRMIYLFSVNESLTLVELVSAFGKGLIFDFAVGLYALMPITLLGLLPYQVLQNSLQHRITYIWFYIVSGVLSWVAICEYFFIQEFHSRFNFIAVDYLVYTNEVIRNLWETYPVAQILSIFVILHFLIVYKLLKYVIPRITLPHARQIHIVLLLLTLFFASQLSESRLLEQVDSPSTETAKNPLYALFAAYHNNEINFKRFYSSMDKDRAAHIVHESLEADDPTHFAPHKEVESQEDENSIVRNIISSGSDKKMNVVIILMESMSAKFMKSYGAKKELTPNLDHLAQKGLFFDQVYSTGTRTVRGIEAVTLSIPPTPGQSVVRRPDAEQIFNVGSVFRQKGYHTQFIYGGRSFFDNMGRFFSSNGFEVFDQTNMSTDEIHFANAWGVCDEDLFAFAIKQADQHLDRPFFQFLLTTSNHRPYTYPSGRIDIPSHTGREGAVKYADFAIGEYLRQVEQKPWFNSTVFVFVADHNASVAGGTKILPSDYQIPVIYYAPQFIQPYKSSILGSQIDVVPTLLSLLKFSYQSRFFGHDLLSAKTQRAFLATYQIVGLWQNQKLILLSPNRRIDTYSTAPAQQPKHLTTIFASTDQDFSDPDIEQTIGFYEAASDWFRERLLKESLRMNSHTNIRFF